MSCSSPRACCMLKCKCGARSVITQWSLDRIFSRIAKNVYRNIDKTFKDNKLYPNLICKISRGNLPGRETAFLCVLGSEGYDRDYPPVDRFHRHAIKK